VGGLKPPVKGGPRLNGGADDDSGGIVSVGGGYGSGEYPCRQGVPSMSNSVIIITQRVFRFSTVHQTSEHTNGPQTGHCISTRQSFEYPDDMNHAS
jgi:hypothetical protein